MLVFTLSDGSKLHVDESSTIVTNKGPMQADQAQVGLYLRPGTHSLLRIDMIVQQ